MEAVTTTEVEDGIGRCSFYGGYHVYNAGPCFDTIELARKYKAKLDKKGVKWMPSSIPSGH